MTDVKTFVVAACGLCQGFLGFPSILMAPWLALRVASTWGLPPKSIRVSNTICLLIVLLGLLVGHMAIASATLMFGEGPDALRIRGRWWAVFVGVGALMYAVLPGIESRLRPAARSDRTPPDASS